MYHYYDMILRASFVSKGAGRLFQSFILFLYSEA